MKNKYFYHVFLFVCLSVLSIEAQAGSGMGMGTTTTGSPCGGIFPPCPVPLDNGTIFLLIAGISYGGYKIYSLLKKNPA